MFILPTTLAGDALLTTYYNLLFVLLWYHQVAGKITEEGVFIEALETNPSKYLPDVKTKQLRADVVEVCQN